MYIYIYVYFNSLFVCFFLNLGKSEKEEKKK